MSDHIVEPTDVSADRRRRQSTDAAASRRHFGTTDELLALWISEQ